MLKADAYESLVKAKRELESAKGRGTGVMAAKEKMKNLLLNYYDDLIELAAENQRLEAEVKTLETGLDESDAENDQLRKTVKQLREQLAGLKLQNARPE